MLHNEEQNLDSDWEHGFWTLRAVYEERIVKNTKKAGCGGAYL